MNGLSQAQAHYDRRLPPEIDLEDEPVRRVADLNGHEVQRITERFICDLAHCEVLHNFMDDAGGLAGDLDFAAQLLAQAWLRDAETVARVVGDSFWQNMKQAALSRWEKGHD